MRKTGSQIVHFLKWEEQNNYWDTGGPAPIGRDKLSYSVNNF
jgi:hypothetical protein